MNKDKYIFAQFIEFLDNNKFHHLVDKYDGNRYVKHFTCWNQLLAMMFGQLSNRESLRDLIIAFEAHRAKQYHLGLGRKPIAKTTFASANQNRDYRIFEENAVNGDVDCQRIQYVETWQKPKLGIMQNSLKTNVNTKIERRVQSIHCIFMTIYAVYGLHLNGKDAVYVVYLCYLCIWNKLKCKDYGQECYKADNTLATRICGQSKITGTQHKF